MRQVLLNSPLNHYPRRVSGSRYLQACVLADNSDCKLVYLASKLLSNIFFSLYVRWNRSDISSNFWGCFLLDKKVGFENKRY